ncbi:MAG: hypothetical protein AABY22_02890 [Nanoarchaeota archaeon]
MENQITPKQLTQTEALEQGYTYCSYEDGEYMTKIKGLGEIDLLEDNRYFVAEKKPTYPTIDDGTLAEIISDHLYGQEIWADDTDNITKCVAKAIEEHKIDELINKSLEHLEYYMVTKIKLVSDNIKEVTPLTNE